VTVQAMIPAVSVFAYAFRQNEGLNNLLFKWPKTWSWSWPFTAVCWWGYQFMALSMY